MELKRRVKGLGLAKASFAACLLYPLDADLACVDTWIQKVFLGHTGFKSLSLGDYLLVESKIRTYANCFNVSTFVAQWLIWDHARGGAANAHAIFPGGHK
jgi:thermostable 8-oxoguanine DNA glycosylase